MPGQVQVLAEDLAKPLREKLGSPQYTEVLLAACFVDTVEAARVSGISAAVGFGVTRGCRSMRRARGNLMGHDQLR